MSSKSYAELLARSHRLSGVQDFGIRVLDNGVTLLKSELLGFVDLWRGSTLNLSSSSNI